MKKIVVIGIFCLLMLPASAFGHKLIPTDGTNIDYESALNIPDLQQDRMPVQAFSEICFPLIRAMCPR